MEVKETQTQSCKFPRRIGNGRNESGNIGQKGSENYPDDEEEGELIKRGGVNGGAAGGDASAANGFRGWHHSSRIIRVSRASGGKDRHSKVWTSKGPRDRRVRLSVTTAIQFYDLQDRLGYDQPSKAVEWLIKAASDSISELPSLKGAFPETPKQLSDEKRASGSTEQGFDSAEAEIDGDPNNYQQHQSQHISLSKSACSSTSETSKNSTLSLSRPEIRVNRVKARVRARERAAKDKEKEHESRTQQHQNVNPISQNASFTELLTGGIGSSVGNSNSNSSPPSTSAQQNPNGAEANLFHKAAAVRQWPVTPMDYFGGGGLLGPSSSRGHHSSGLSGQIQLGNSLQQSMCVPPFNISSENHQELQHFAFVPDHLIPVATTQPGPGADYNLNFTISPGLAGFNRGTLQSNSPSFPPHLQRYSPPLDGSPFFIGTPPVENHHHHQFPAGFDGRLQLCYGDGSRNTDQKGKGKN